MERISIGITIFFIMYLIVAICVYYAHVRDQEEIKKKKDEKR